MAVPLADALMLRWFVRDLDIRSNLIAATVQEPLSGLILTGSTPRIAGFFNRMLQDERLYAIGLCLDERKTPIATSQFPPEIRCGALETYADAGQRTLRSTRGLLHLAIRPVDSEATPDARLVLVHDMNFVERRSEETRQYLFYFFIALGGCIALITVVIAQLSWRGWVQGLRALLRGEGILRPARFIDRAGAAPDRRRPARPDPRPRAAVPAARRQPAHLGSTGAAGDVAQRAPRQRRDRRIEPRALYPRAHVRGNTHPAPRAAACVTALEPVMRACSGTWIAHGSGSADRETVDRHDRVGVPPGQPLYQVRRIWLTPEEERGYYGGFANEGLWPLCHIAHVRPTFRTGDFEHYRNVNTKFADAVVAEAKTKDPVVLVQDYHFALLPRMIRNACPTRPSSRSGTSPGPTRKRSRSVPGASSCSTVCSGAASSAFTRSSTATISWTPSTGCWRRASTASPSRSPAAASRPPCTVIRSRSSGHPHRSPRRRAFPDARRAVRERLGLPREPRTRRRHRPP